MFNGLLADDQTYVLDFVTELPDGRRFIVCRETCDAVTPHTPNSTPPHSGADLTQWRANGQLSKNTRFVDGTQFHLGAHGEWLTHDEFVAWRTAMDATNLTTPHESLIAPESQGRSSFSFRPCRRRAFVAFLLVALIIGLFVPTIELFKAPNISMGRAPLWWAYVGLFMLDELPWSLPFGLIAAHWSVAIIVAWCCDRLVNVVRPAD